MDDWATYITDHAETAGEPPCFYIRTMGCQMNERDSETIAGLLIDMGLNRTERKETADLVIINTCSVRDNADQRFFGTLGQVKKIKEANSRLIVGVCGCMMQQEHVVDEVKAKYPWVDIVFGTHNIHMLPELLRGAAIEKKKRVEVWEEGGEIIEGLPARREFPFKAYVNVMYGCDNFCTYCIVPYTRGRERSRKPDEILSEARGLARNGVKEIMLLGQNVNSYKGIDEGGAVDFPELIYRLNEISGLRRIRFMTSHPKDLSKRLAAAYRDCEKLCKVIHLPVQSGSSRVLALMNRNYTKEYYLDMIGLLRGICPNIAVTTDIIVGFPGEGDEDFEETLELAEQVKFDSAFTFLFSARKGTPAASYEAQVSEEEKRRRFNRLLASLNGIAAEKNKTYIGRRESLLVEGAGKTGENVMAGRMDNGKLVNFVGAPELTGEFVDVRITEAKTFSLFGELTYCSTD
ncbi:MAG: tRNA (N6-isopentenyl adenosine(37)-C2)-methylthiotransferase MiaB [Clostridiales Family XIII bacterium]|jgi:tRNA-2-methylthio-N6-dimethylallyladenosine synthase|nr:tRNA (N6-isopentenyl adenosine(37)-C2)-methylthiotransferase MiaB [Clostridiales Family XIII bacterium]